MKIRKLILVGFLMVLYIAPFILTPYSISPTIPTDQNMNKDFQNADGENWLTEWRCRKALTVEGHAGGGGATEEVPQNYSIFLQVTYEGFMQADFDDLRFTESDGSTELDYWIENYTASTAADVWVRINTTIPANNDDTLYMYYGNSAVSTTSNGTNTFLFYDDFENNNFNRWDITNSDWEIDNTVEKRGAYCAFGNSAGSRELYSTKHNFTTDFLVQTWFRVTDHTISEYRYGIFLKGATTIAGVIAYQNDWVWWNGGLQTWESNTVVADTWFLLECAFSFEEDEVTLWKDGLLVGTHDFDDYTATNVEYVDHVGCLTDGTANADQYQDNYIVRMWNTDGEPTVSVGSEEINPDFAPSWVEVDDIDVVLYINYDYWALNMSLIFGGLILMLVTACYMAVKVRDRNLSQDAAMLMLLLFCVGFGLFIGGAII